MAARIGIFFGSDTGNTENVASMIQKEIGEHIADVFDILKSTKEDLEKYDKLLFGIPTWYYGEPQCDWDDFLPILKEIDFSRKTIALFGCGDQEDYSEYFCDAMFILYTIIKLNRGISIGHWPIHGYHFKSSKSVINNNFVGLAIDEDRQPEMTSKRIKFWVKQIFKELRLNND
ncbi:flavodoxin FldA [Blochmannia endosymbiont of Polyrhachis (Hedomyrma) turneri]|uniref:flavodoxin FldA n=1 Tax=Blochmannia endosymbiont of Polyrhachis (Hedomyrma) turneri TaxID=1505596 RepID=UPI00061A70E5|nr:flavodoxin FldA [Blochmannia endosymbiont of Polyrhachis (Hedomyrma) turneri]AKC59892.1 Flavodoxin-1 [Blochmannia endosymbiont of Polyrhachis (Hedomyrma) turneri]